jgi:hypothetical protein
MTTDPLFGGNDRISGGEGNDTVYGGAANDTIYGGVGNDLIFGDGSISGSISQPSPLPPAGGEPGGNDLIYGESGNDTIRGGASDDTIYGGLGNDDLNGGIGQTGFASGEDLIFAGQGTDALSTDFANGLPTSATSASHTYQITSDFAVASSLRNQPQAGSWSAFGGRYVGTPGIQPAISVRQVTLASTNLDLQVNVSTRGIAGLVFDYRSTTDFRFVAIDIPSGRVILGRRVATGTGWVIDASVALRLTADRDTLMGVSIRGQVITVAVDRTNVMNFRSTSQVSYGTVGLMARDASASFDNFVTRGDQAAFADGGLRLSAAPGESLATSGVSAPLAMSDLSAIVHAALERWTEQRPDAADLLANVKFEIADLPGDELGRMSIDSILIDPTAAGHGWFIDPSPMNDDEFGPAASPFTQATDRVDLLTVVMHELGHVLELADLDADDHHDDLMTETLPTGTRRTLAFAETVIDDRSPVSTLPPVFRRNAALALTQHMAPRFAAVPRQPLTERPRRAIKIRPAMDLLTRIAALGHPIDVHAGQTTPNRNRVLAHIDATLGSIRPVSLVSRARRVLDRQ